MEEYIKEGIYEEITQRKKCCWGVSKLLNMDSILQHPQLALADAINNFAYKKETNFGWM